MIPSFYFLPATFTNHINTIEVQERHTLYETDVTARLALMRTGQKVRFPWPFEEDKMVQHLTRSGECEPVKLDAEHLPRILRRNVAMVNAPWLSRNGVEWGLLCAMCLYSSEQYHLYTRSDFEEHLESCRVRPFTNYYFYYLTWTSNRCFKLAIK
jgi:hypothetical protein